MNNLNLFFTMKAPASGCMDCVLAREDIQTFAGQDGMSKECDSTDCEYRW